MHNHNTVDPITYCLINACMMDAKKGFCIQFNEILHFIIRICAMRCFEHPIVFYGWFTTELPDHVEK